MIIIFDRQRKNINLRLIIIGKPRQKAPRRFPSTISHPSPPPRLRLSRPFLDCLPISVKAFLQGCTSQLLHGAAPLCGGGTEFLMGSEALARTFVLSGTNRTGNYTWCGDSGLLPRIRLFHWFGCYRDIQVGWP